MPDATQKQRDIALSTVLGDDALVLERVSGSERLGQPFEYRVVAFAEDDSFAFDDLVGTRAAVRIEMGQPGTRFLNGVISQVRHVGYTVQGRSRYELVLVPWIWLLGRTSDCRIFQNKTVPEIIKEIFSENGHSDFKIQLQGNYPQRVYCVQYRETDLNFVQRLIEHEGIYYHTEHEKSKHTLVFCDSMSAHKPAPGFEALRYRARQTGLRDEIRVHTWQVSKQITPGAYGVNSFDFESPIPSPTSRLIGMSQQAHPFKEGEAEIYDNPGDYVQRSEGERYAKVRREEIQAETEVASGQTDARGLIPGVTFKLEENPKDNQNRDYLVISFAFHAECGNYESSGGSGAETYEASFSCIPRTAVFRPFRCAVAPVVKGPQTAIVVGPAGEEIYTDKFGRVKVQFFWDRYGRSDSGSSCWIRVAQAWAGKSFGGMAIPRIGHEVIVDFLEGDPDRPIITGRVYNGSNMPNPSNAGRDGKPGNVPPADLTKAAMMTSFKSNSLGGSGGYNEITMNDTGGSEGLFFKAQKDEIHKVGNDREDEVGNNEDRKVGNNRTREVGNNETVTVGTSRSMTVGANHTETIGANQSITIGSSKTETVSITSTESVGAAKFLNVGAAFTTSVGAAMAVSVGGAMAITVGAASMTNVAGTYSLKAKKISLEAEDEISIKVGGAQIVMKKSGDIMIKGANIKIKGKKIEQN